MSKEEYRDCIKKMIDEIIDGRALKLIFHIVHRMYMEVIR